MRGVLRRRASVASALVLFVGGALAGVALADGPSLGGITTSVVAGTGPNATVSVPTVTAPSVTTPTVTTPAVTTPTVTTPTVTTPGATTPAVTTPTLTTPTVTPPAVTTPAVKTPTVSVTAPVPPGTTTPTVGAKVAVGPQPAVTVSSPVVSAASSVSTSALPAGATAAVSAQVAHPGGISATIGSSASVPKPAGGSATEPVDPTASPGALNVTGDGRATASGSASVAIPTTGARLFAKATDGRTSQRALPETISAFSSTPARTAIGMADLSPLARVTGARSFAGVPPTATAFEPRSSPSSGSTVSAVVRHPAALGGAIAALIALVGLGLAGGARSGAFAAACADLARFPFPRFRILPCPEGGTSIAGSAGGGGVSSVSNGGSTRASIRGRAAPTAHASGTWGSPLPPLPSIPALGARVVKTPWSIVRTLVVALLAVVNALVLGIRWRVGRLQAR